ncbi:MAG: cysteine--tRNA ligase [Methyloligellaceae bacterium]
MELKLYNTLTGKKEAFKPLDENNVRMYVCGPTVYDHAHIGNARPVIVFDVLYRLLRHVYGAEHVTYARNITDVDDKINARAAEEGVSIEEVTARTTKQFHDDIAAFGVLPPDVEPRATDHIEQMKALIERLVKKGNAYVAQDHVLFHVPSMPDYGKLSKRSTDEMEAGARVEVAPYKKDPMDFVLWKPSKDNEPAWDSPCGIEQPGRPGWHIECSAMSAEHLGETFDIHGGGVDLVFPHHENEIAQSRCGFGTDIMAQLWMHNGYLQVEGRKMAKSEGNFITIHDLLETTAFGGQKWHGLVLRLAMLMTHYRQPIDWTSDRLFEARSNLYDWNLLCFEVPGTADVPLEVIGPILDDMNFPGAIAAIHVLAREVSSKSQEPDIVNAALRLRMALEFLGLYSSEPTVDLLKQEVRDRGFDQRVNTLIEARNAARAAKDFAEADRIRDELAKMKIVVEDKPDGKTEWKFAR